MPSLGAITFTDGPIRATINQSDPTAQVAAHTFWVQHVPGNLAEAYIGDATMNTLNLDGVMHILPAPDANNSAPRADIPGAASRMNAHEMSSVYVDGRIGDTVIVGYTQA